jgi:hypothetical protein
LRQVDEAEEEWCDFATSSSSPAGVPQLHRLTTDEALRPAARTSFVEKKPHCDLPCRELQGMFS